MRRATCLREDSTRIPGICVSVGKEKMERDGKEQLNSMLRCVVCVGLRALALWNGLIRLLSETHSIGDSSDA